MTAPSTLFRPRQPAVVRPADFQTDDTHADENVRHLLQFDSDRSLHAIHGFRICNFDDSGSLRVQHMRRLSVDQPVEVEDGIRRQCHVFGLLLVPEVPVQREMVVVDDDAYFWWEIEESEGLGRWPTETLYDVCTGTEESFDRGQHLYENPHLEHDECCKCEAQYVKEFTTEALHFAGCY